MGTKALETRHQRVMAAVLAKLYTMSYNTHVVTHTNKDRVIIFCASTMYSAISLLFLFTSSNQICVVLHCFTTSSSNAVRRSLLLHCLSFMEKLSVSVALTSQLPTQILFLRVLRLVWQFHSDTLIVVGILKNE